MHFTHFLKSKNAKINARVIFNASGKINSYLWLKKNVLCIDCDEYEKNIPSVIFSKEDLDDIFVPSVTVFHL